MYQTPEYLPQSLPAFLMISSERASGTKYPKVIKEYTWESIYMADIKEIKQTIVSHGILSSFIREMVKTWTSCNKAMAQDRTQIISVVLENGPQLIWKC